ncbi:MAG: transpeptidase family protein [Treponema sp.]|jgi:cell division protein FtsI (penicillin-binding protein 3)|nr:transpeptidase family protein [Treponema sp.]
MIVPDEITVFSKRFAVYIVIVGILIISVIIAYAIVMLSPTEDTGGLRIANPPLERGTIFDRNQQLLAMDTKVGLVSLRRNELMKREQETKQQVLDESLCQELSVTLAPILGMSRQEILDKIYFSPSYIVLKKKIDKSVINRINAAKKGILDQTTESAITVRFTDEPNEKERNKNIETTLKTARNRLKTLMRKVRLDIVSSRVYPQENLASQIIGFVGDDNKGHEGIEYLFDDVLSPTEMETGKHIVLTIDIKIQHILEKIAADAMSENKAESIMLTAMDAQTGEILGSASLPSFNPNEYYNYPDSTWRYKPALFAYEPGSVFKLFSISALLDTGVITENSVFNCTGHYDRVNPSITDLQVHGMVTPEKIIALSCNVGVSLAVEHIGNEVFYNKLTSFGFGKKMETDIPSEVSGIFNPLGNIDKRAKPAMGMGQGIAVNMLQMLQAATAIADNGVMVQPHLVAFVRNSEGKEEAFERKSPVQVIKPRTASSMLRFMQTTVTESGTGWRAAIGDIPMAVKTGTAQVIENRVYSETDFIASCMAIFPTDKPSIILYVVIVKPQGASYLGGRIATIPIRQAAEELVDYLGLPRGKNARLEHSRNVTIPSNIPLPVLKDIMPNFTGFSKQNLLPLLSIRDFHVELKGVGHVSSQDPVPGTPLIHGDKITLYLE